MLVTTGRLRSATALVLYLVLLFASNVRADTEIRNFRLPLPHSDVNAPSSPTDIRSVKAGNSNHNVSNTDPELWLGWMPDDAHKSWTARISWPASSPTRFGIDLSMSDDSDTILIHITSAALSPRISGIPFPRPIRPIQLVTMGKDEYFTPFTLTLEPLIMGVLPQTAVPALIWIIIFGLGAACTIPTIRRYMEKAHEWADSGSRSKAA